MSTAILDGKYTDKDLNWWKDNAIILKELLDINILNTKESEKFFCTVFSKCTTEIKLQLIDILSSIECFKDMPLYGHTSLILRSWAFLCCKQSEKEKSELGPEFMTKLWSILPYDIEILQKCEHACNFIIWLLEADYLVIFTNDLANKRSNKLLNWICQNINIFIMFDNTKNLIKHSAELFLINHIIIFGEKCIELMEIVKSKDMTRNVIENIYEIISIFIDISRDTKKIIGNKDEYSKLKNIRETVISKLII